VFSQCSNAGDWRSPSGEDRSQGCPCIAPLMRVGCFHPVHANRSHHSVIAESARARVSETSRSAHSSSSSASRGSYNLGGMIIMGKHGPISMLCEGCGIRPRGAQRSAEHMFGMLESPLVDCDRRLRDRVRRPSLEQPDPSASRRPTSRPTFSFCPASTRVFVCQLSRRFDLA
jgi:hypothetical protein